MLVRAISQIALLGITLNFVCICILPSTQRLLIMSDLDLHIQGHLALKHSKSGHFGLVCTISKKVLNGFSSNSHRICILFSFQHLLYMGDIDFHRQGHLGQKHLKFCYFRGLTCMVNYRVNFSPMTFQLCTNRVHIGMFNIRSFF